MRIVRDFRHCPDACKGAVVAIGNFDGVHLGHRAILETCTREAKRMNRPAAVMTFEPHPREFFARGSAPLRLYSFRSKAEALQEWGGLAALFVARFNARFASLTPEAFVHLLKEELGVRHVVTGDNFAFGKGRLGNTDMLAQAARTEGFGFTAVTAVRDASGEAISSTRIRKLLAEGNVAGAKMLLGRPYVISGHVRRGEARGRTLGFPTANIALDRLFAPRLGIYAARATVGETSYDAVVSIGTKPTFAVTKPLLETHCFGLTRECYGERMQVELVEFLRDERKFENAGSLRTQMEEDARQAQAVLAQGRSEPYAHCR